MTVFMLVLVLLPFTWREQMCGKEIGSDSPHLMGSVCIHGRENEKSCRYEELDYK
jgi:hypothetical protein